MHRRYGAGAINPLHYKQEKVALGSEDIAVTQSDLWVSPDYPFLGAAPDAATYDPSETQAFDLQR